MATKGYNSYRGRLSARKKLLTVLLVLVLLGSAVFLLGQDYLVYDGAGNVRLELPFLDFFRNEEDSETGDLGDVDLTIEEPQRPTIDLLQAQELPSDVLNGDIQAKLASLPETVVIQIKQTDGSLTYHPTFVTAKGVRTGDAMTTANLKAILESDRYTVARISCFADMAFAKADMVGASLQRDDKWLWYDDYASCWTDPAKDATREYLQKICAECVEMGFDEILLDQFSYPVKGRLDRILNVGSIDKTAELTEVLASLRQQLPKITGLSVVLRYNEPEKTGLTMELLQQFDRIYVDTGTVDMAKLAGQLPAGFDQTTRLVAMVRTAPASGSYMLVQ